MGNIECFAATSPSHQVDGENVSLQRQTSVRNTGTIIYIVAFVMWTMGWAVAWAKRKVRPYLFIGYVIGAAFLLLNAWQAQNETVSSYSVEQAEASILARNTFSIIMAMFALAGLIARLDTKVLKATIPLVIGAMFFAVVVGLGPVWVSTVDPVPTIEMKHLRSVCTIYALGLLTSALAAILPPLMEMKG